MKNIQLSLKAIIVLSAIFLSGAVFAQVSSTELVEAGLRPGDTFYFVDQTGEAIKKVFTTDPIKRATYSEQLSQERLAEATSLTVDGRISDAERAVEMYAREFGVASSTLLNVDGTLNVDEVIKQKELLANNATRNLVVLEDMSSQDPSITYTVELAQARTVNNQLQVIDDIAKTDEQLATNIYWKAVDTNVLIIEEKAGTLTDRTQLSNIDSSIRNYNTYIKYASEADLATLDSRATQESMNGVATILGGTQTNTRVVDGTTVTNTERADGSFSNPNADGTVTADTGAPRIISSSNAGAPAYQSNNGALSWMNYILSR